MKPHGMKMLHGQKDYCRLQHPHTEGDRFGRMFPDLPALYVDPQKLNNIGAAYVPMDPEKPDGETKPGPMNAAGSGSKAKKIDIGYVFFGQFIDHDVTLDFVSTFDQVNNAEVIENARTPTLDLDALYGAGPEAAPYFYHQSGEFAGIKLVTGNEVYSAPPVKGEKLAELRTIDLPRVGKIALIGDPRNDENRVISQIHLNMIRFHNSMCDRLSTDFSGQKLYEEARRIVTWTYQWCIVNDFLRKICGDATVDRILARGRKFYCPAIPYIPVEFSVAAFRFGHSMVPETVDSQEDGLKRTLFGRVYGRPFTPIASPKAQFDMHELFPTHDKREVQRSQALDSKLEEILFHLDSRISDKGSPSLAQRNLLRGQSFLLPSGEAVAESMASEISETGRFRLTQAVIDGVSEDARVASNGNLSQGTPLWYYILMEAETIGVIHEDASSDPGEGLGPVGATLVAEVLIGLLELDSRSWLGSNRTWRPPTLISQKGEKVELTKIGNMLTAHQLP